MMTKIVLTVDLAAIKIVVITEMIYIYDIMPEPVTSDGHWVLRRNFPYKKSFGYFKCDDCNKWWISAHSFKEYKQGCKRCEKMHFPKYMWLNDEKEETKADKEDNGTPHDTKRCEACKMGICLDKLRIK